MASENRTVGVYDRPRSADRPPIWAFVVIALIIVASALLTYFLWAE
mgnify:CR=1 FL=1